MPSHSIDVIRTDLHCHSCSKSFVAELDADIDGNHEICCPHCDHIHYRVLKDGEVTGDRYSSDGSSSAKTVPARSVWRSSVIHCKTSSVAAHIRERWMNRSDFNGR